VNPAVRSDPVYRIITEPSARAQQRGEIFCPRDGAEEVALKYIGSGEIRRITPSKSSGPASIGAGLMSNREAEVPYVARARQRCDIALLLRDQIRVGGTAVGDGNELTARPDVTRGGVEFNRTPRRSLGNVSIIRQKAMQRRRSGSTPIPIDPRIRSSIPREQQLIVLESADCTCSCTVRPDHHALFCLNLDEPEVSASGERSSSAGTA